MGADDEIDLAISQTFECFGLLFGGAKTRQLGQLHRPFAKAVGEGIEVLFREQRGRHQNRHLAAIGHGEEGGAQCHLRLAEADIATD